MNLIERKIRNIVRQLLNEERGISDVVYNGANEILKNICRCNDEKIKNGDFINALKRDDTYLIRGTFSFDFENTKLLVTYNTYIFQDEETYNCYCKQYPRMLLNAYATYDDGNPSLYVVYNNVGGEYDESIYDRLQHELEHCFQQIKKEGDLCVSNLRYAVDRGLKKKKTDIDIYMASWILYCSRHHEQDAYANGLYSWLKNGKKDKNEIVKRSGLAKYRRICIKYIDVLRDYLGNNEIENKIYTFFGITLSKIIKKGEETCEKLKNKGNRIIYKYIEETDDNVDFIR